MKKLTLILSFVITLSSFKTTKTELSNEGIAVISTISGLAVIGITAIIALLAWTPKKVPNPEIIDGISRKEVDINAINDSAQITKPKNFKEAFFEFADTVKGLPEDTPGLAEIRSSIDNVLNRIIKTEPLTSQDMNAFNEAKTKFEGLENKAEVTPTTQTEELINSIGEQDLRFTYDQADSTGKVYTYDMTNESTIPETNIEADLSNAIYDIPPNSEAQVPSNVVYENPLNSDPLVLNNPTEVL